MRKLQIGIIGPEEKNLPKIVGEQMLREAEKVGELLAEKGCIVITGGMDGIMEAASKGAKAKGGITVGTPGRTRGISNKFVEVEICTPIDVGDFIFAGTLSSDALIVFPGDAGTMAELCIAYRCGKPQIIIDKFGWKNLDNIINNKIKSNLFRADTPEEAVELAIKLAKRQCSIFYGGA